jgi:hypothetical protein
LLALYLIAQECHLALEARYERVAVRVYPFVLPAVYPTSTPCVQVDVYAPVVFLIVLESVTSHALADGALGDAESAGRFLDGETVYPSSIPFVHAPYAGPFGDHAQALGSHPRRTEPA